MDGILILNKPSGWTSHDVVAKTRGILRTKKIGHTGTLDPMATGVLVLCIGSATRIADYLAAGEKEYIADAVLGQTTDTQDADGKIIASADASALTAEIVESALCVFRGAIKQIPPMVSAVHHNGQRLYELARKNQVVEREPRDVTISKFEMLDFQPGQLARASFRVVCSKGTYVRTLCHDLGERLGTGAHLKGLMRTRVGQFRLEQAITIDELAELAQNERATERMFSIVEALSHLPSYSVSDAETQIVLHGGRIVIAEGSELTESEEIIILSPNGLLLAIAKKVGDGKSEFLQPVKVFSEPEAIQK